MAKRPITLLFADSFEELTPTELGTLLAQLEVVVKMHKSAKAFVEAEIANGRPVPGWELGDGKRSKEWESEAKAIAAMSLAGINDPYKRTLMTPTQATETCPDDPVRLAHIEAAWKWKPGNKTLKQSAMSALAASASPNYGF